MAQRSVERDDKTRSYGPFCQQKFGNHSFPLVPRNELRRTAHLKEAEDEAVPNGAKKSGENQLDDPKRPNENLAKSDPAKFHETWPVWQKSVPFASACKESLLADRQPTKLSDISTTQRTKPVPFVALESYKIPRGALRRFTEWKQTVRPRTWEISNCLRKIWQ